MSLINTFLAAALGVALAQQPQPPEKTSATAAALDGHLVRHPKSKSVAITAKKSVEQSGGRDSVTARATRLRTPMPPVSARAKATKPVRSTK